LRRTAATLAASCGFSDSAIARCLNHQSGKAENVSAVTAIYVRADRLNEKREVLDGVAVELRRIIGPRLRLTA
jgi:hypothetical protein